MAKINLQFFFEGPHSISLTQVIVLYCIVYTLWSHVNEWYMKFMVSLPQSTAQGSRSAALMGRG